MSTIRAQNTSGGASAVATPATAPGARLEAAGLEALSRKVETGWLGGRGAVDSSWLGGLAELIGRAFRPESTTATLERAARETEAATERARAQRLAMGPALESFDASAEGKALAHYLDAINRSAEPGLPAGEEFVLPVLGSNPETVFGIPIPSLRFVFNGDFLVVATSRSLRGFHTYHVDAPASGTVLPIDAELLSADRVTTEALLEAAHAAARALGAGKRRLLRAHVSAEDRLVPAGHPRVDVDALRPALRADLADPATGGAKLRARLAEASETMCSYDLRALALAIVDTLTDAIVVLDPHECTDFRLPIPAVEVLGVATAIVAALAPRALSELEQRPVVRALDELAHRTNPRVHDVREPDNRLAGRLDAGHERLWRLARAFTPPRDAASKALLVSHGWASPE